MHDGRRVNDVSCLNVTYMKDRNMCGCSFEAYKDPRIYAYYAYMDNNVENGVHGTIPVIL